MKRSMVFVLLVAVLLVLGARGVGAVQSRGPATVQYVVKPGDNLWKIARRVDPDGDNRRTVQTIIELNDLSGAGLVPGQPLQLPAA